MNSQAGIVEAHEAFVKAEKQAIEAYEEATIPARAALDASTKSWDATYEAYEEAVKPARATLQAARNKAGEALAAALFPAGQ